MTKRTRSQIGNADPKASARPSTVDGASGKVVSLAMTETEAAKFDELITWHRESKRSNRVLGEPLRK